MAEVATWTTDLERSLVAQRAMLQEQVTVAR